MQFDEFQQKMVAWMEEHIGGRFAVNDVLKTNDTVLKGLTQTPGENGLSVAPTVYLDDIYERYMNHEMTFSAAASMVEAQYVQHSQQSKQVAQMAAGNYTDWEVVKDKVYMNVVGAKANRQLLEQCPHRIVAEDLAETYRVLVQKGQDGIMSYKIDNSMMKVLGVTPDQLHEAAMVNTPAFFPAECTSMIQKMKDLMPVEMRELLEGGLNDVDLKLPDNMYVLSNDVGINGATVMLYPGMLEKLTTEFGKDINILPSSLHEVLICKEGNFTLEELQDIVREANYTSVGPEDFLSDNVYAVRGKELVNCTYQENYEDIELEDFQDQEIDPDMGMEM